MLLGWFFSRSFKDKHWQWLKIYTRLRLLKMKSIFCLSDRDVNFIANKSDINRGLKNFLLLTDYKIN